MRKTVIALMLVLPMLFVLVLYSATNGITVSFSVSASGIRILVDKERWQDGDVLEIDHTDMSDKHIISAEITPANASNKDFSVESDNPELISFEPKNQAYTVKTNGQGTANITVTSKDGGYTDSIPVVVSAGSVYAVDFKLFDSDGDVVPFTFDDKSLTYSRPAAGLIETGIYSYEIGFTGGDSREYELDYNSEESVYADVRVAEQKILLPFGGSVKLDLKVPDVYIENDGISDRVYHINLSTVSPPSETGIVINGVADGAVATLTNGSKETVLFVQSNGEPTIEGEGIVGCYCKTHGAARAAGNHHELVVELDDGFKGDEINAFITVGGKQAPIRLTFAEFDFTLRGDNLKEILASDVDYTLTVLKNTAVSLHAVPVADAQNVTFSWEYEANAPISVVPSSDGRTVSFKATADGDYTVTVKAMYDGKEVSKTVDIKSVTKVNSVTITNNPKTDLAERYTIGGMGYNDKLEIDPDYSGYMLNLLVSRPGAAPVRDNATDIEFDSTDETIAKVNVKDDRAYIVANGTGVVTITAKWAYRDTFNNVTSLTSDFTVNVVNDAVEVSNYPQLKKASEEGRKIVLSKSVALGTDADYDTSITLPTDRNSPTYQSDLQAYRANLQHVLPMSDRKAIAESHRYKSTYNVEFYDQNSDYGAANATVMYAMEFKADVYGNGFNIDAEYITNAQDAAGVHTIFRGPLVFVDYKLAASVAGQDNCAFLIRTDGVKLYGVNLLGCSDSSLFEIGSSGVGEYQLNNLNEIGTTLEINADCELVNCRIRNGRNVVRVYGGNGSGSRYMVTAIPAADLNASERIVVRIEGCVISQGREFLVKVGANKALQANRINGQEPALKGENGVDYKEETKVVNGKTYYTNNYEVGSFDTNSFFYRRYVMTDLTLKNSVLETSGLFTVGVESNFAGALLYEGAADLTGNDSNYAKITPAWRKSGGTSFASILRLAGDVRTYDWKKVANVDSSTLIEPVGDGVLSEVMKFNVAEMLKEVDGKSGYAKLLEVVDGQPQVHGGIAFYGGGRNYSQIDLSQLNDDLDNFAELSINIGQFESSGNAVVQRQAQLLPLAAGNHDFNFWMYSADCANDYYWQQNKSYDGVAKVPLFED